ncbi:MAG TPA: glucose-1-phosphate thymidylyltransferase [Elusimicrobia bacterium]|nr:glucose-1-phosphate thymidylyltransferase [Elusimicrobiota bacterium]HBT60693.1 glucose-1-phosphate thymidylyltransferase [Elusimicrobiota bacterium]
MKALVLSGGKGSRLRPITHTSAKQLIPIVNKPILFYGLEAIAKAGIKEVGIIVGETQAEIRAAVGDGSAFGFKATYIPQEQPLGLAHAVKISRKFMGDSPFLMFLGDNLLKGGLGPLVADFFEQKPNAQILLAQVPNPSAFGVVELEGGKVIRLVEKPKEPKSDLALVGVYLFDKNIFEAIGHIKPSARGELEITDAIQWLVDKGYTVVGKRIEGWWKDTGKLEDLLEANRLIHENIKLFIHKDARVDSLSRLEGRVVIEAGVEVLESVIRGPAVIGANSRIIRSYVGPYSSIYYDALVENSEIEHSIVLEHARIRDIRRIQDSLIGQRVEVVRSGAKPEAYRIMVGDSSRIEIP